MTDIEAVISAVDATLEEARAYLEGAPDNQNQQIVPSDRSALRMAMGMFQTFRDKLIAARHAGEPEGDL